jgi:hypothetical protein
MNSPLHQLRAAGVSIWLDDLSRDRIESGSLKELITTRAVSGVTTNPTIFAGAFSKGAAYASQLEKLATSGATADEAIFEATTDDVRAACDVFADVHFIRPVQRRARADEGCDRFNEELALLIAVRYHYAIVSLHDVADEIRRSWCGFGRRCGCWRN